MSIVKLDQIILRNMKRLGEPAARISLFIIFFWFGILKPLGVSAAEPLVLKTVQKCQPYYFSISMLGGRL